MTDTNRPWIGVDLDGTLAEYHGWRDDGQIGPPVPLMVDRVLKWLREGKDVRIVTARVSPPNVEEQTVLVKEWCAKHLGTVLPVTCSKDYQMLELWDDRAIQVISNTGLRVDGDYNAVTVYG